MSNNVSPVDFEAPGLVDGVLGKATATVTYFQDGNLIKTYFVIRLS